MSRASHLAGEPAERGPGAKEARRFFAQAPASTAVKAEEVPVIPKGKPKSGRGEGPLKEEVKRGQQGSIGGFVWCWGLGAVWR